MRLKNVAFPKLITLGIPIVALLFQQATHFDEKDSKYVFALSNIC